MKKLFLISILSLSILFPYTSAAQCGFDVIRQKQLMDPAFKLQEQENELKIKNFVPPSNITGKVGSILTIPVVVHVLHKGEAVGTGTNISTAQIQSAIDRLNVVYRGLDPNSPIDFEIEFSLAKRDPNCNSSTGINRINATSVSGYSANGVLLESVGADENALKDLSRWPETDYFNIWIVSEIDGNNGGFGIQGYANFYNGNAYEGSVMMASVFGYDLGNTNGWNLNSNGDGSTVIHEFGHYFHLYHTFQGDNDDANCPGDAVIGTDSDGCADTEIHKRYTSTCPTNNDCLGNNPYGLNTRNNYMSYFNCTDRLTNNQKTRVTAAMTGTSIVASKGAIIPDPSYAAPVAVCNTNTVTTNNSGITSVELNGTTYTSFSSSSDGGNIDRSANCSGFFEIDATVSNTINVGMYTVNFQQLGVWIDWNDDGDFNDDSEQQHLSQDISANTTVPVVIDYPTNIPYGDYVRIRLITDLDNRYGPGTINSACYSSIVYGQSEDYTIYIQPSLALAPVANFSGTPTTLCAGNSVSFSDLSTNTPTSWSWTFTGGTPSSSSAQNPTITYNTPGTYQVQLTATNAGGSDAETKVGYITVNSTNTASASSSNPTLCVNTLMTNITHTTTGATGIGTPTNLPAGVTAGFASNTITISGTPSVSGTFNYSIPLTGGCGTVNATGTITVNPLPANAAAITGVTSACDNATSVAYSISSVSGATGYTWTVPAGATVASGQNTTNITVDFGTTSGNVAVTPTNSCGNGGQASKAVTIAPCGSAPVADFSTNITTICVGESINFSDLSTNSPTSWLWNFGDGGSSSSQNTTYTYNTPGTYTVTLTATNGSGSDDEVKTNLITVNSLDDASFNYPQSSFCQDGSDPTPTILGTQGGTFTRSPLGLVISSTTGVIDLSASVAGVYTVTYSTGGTCSDVQNTQITINTCGTTELKPIYRKTYLSYSEKLACYIVSGAQDYEWEFSPVGGGSTFNYVRGNNNPSILLGWINGIQDGVTYNVRIRAKVGGVFGSYGNAWQITTPGSSSQTQIISSFCGKIYSSYSDLLNAYTVANATDYEFEFSPIGGGTMVNHIHTGNSILLSSVVGLVDNTTYNVRVRVKVSGSFGPYGQSCSITTPSIGLTLLKTEYCGLTYATMSSKIACYSVTGAEDYQFEFTPVGGGTALVDSNISTSPSTLLNRIIGVQNSTTYNVRVRARLSGVYQAFGASCQITTPSAAMELNETARFMENQEAVEEVKPTTLSIYPNPNTGDQINMVMENLKSNSTVMITDIYGKVILNKPLNTDLNQYNLEVKFDGKLSTGFYFVTVISEGSKVTEKLIVR